MKKQPSQNTLINREYSIDELPDVTASIQQALCAKEQFCLWLEGDLGAGKTTIVRQILYSMGYPKTQPITSPTFGYLNEYEISGRWYGHLDLYRLTSTLPAELEASISVRAYQGLFVEWPKKDLSDLLSPSHIMTIELCSSTSRKLTLKTVN